MSPIKKSDDRKAQTSCTQCDWIATEERGIKAKSRTVNKAVEHCHDTHHVVTVTTTTTTSYYFQDKIV